MTRPTYPSFHNDASKLGLTDAECLCLASAAGALPGGWFVQRDRDDLGHSTVFLLGPEIGDNLPVFLISREHGCLVLGLGLAESYLPLGRHGDVQGVVECLVRTIDRLKAVSHWMAVELVQNWATSGSSNVTHTPEVEQAHELRTREGLSSASNLRMFFTRLEQKLRRRW